MYTHTIICRMYVHKFIRRICKRHACLWSWVHPKHLTCTSLKSYQRGATDPQMGVFFKCPQIWALHWQLSNSVPNGSRLHSSWVWLLAKRGPMLNRLRREIYFSGTCVPDLTNPAPIWNNFKVFNPFNEYHCNRNERKWLSGWCFMRISAIFPRKSPH